MYVLKFQCLHWNFDKGVNCILMSDVSENDRRYGKNYIVTRSPQGEEVLRWTDDPSPRTGANIRSTCPTVCEFSLCDLQNVVEHTLFSVMWNKRISTLHTGGTLITWEVVTSSPELLIFHMYQCNHFESHQHIQYVSNLLRVFNFFTFLLCFCLN